MTSKEILPIVLAITWLQLFFQRFALQTFFYPSLQLKMQTKIQHKETNQQSTAMYLELVKFATKDS